MFQRLVWVTLLVSLTLAACTTKTALRFTNETDCGTATITLTHLTSGTLADHAVEPGETVEIEIDPDTDYHYVVTYPRQPDNTQCDPKTVTTRLKKGTTLKVTLDSVFEEQTPTPATPTPTT